MRTRGVVMAEHSLTISFANRQRLSDKYWLRLELVEADDGQMTVGEAADFIDALYDVSICGQEAPAEPPVEESEKPSGSDWDRALANFGNLPTCDAYDAMGLGDNGAYEVDIKVWRSHPRTEQYKLILSNGIAYAPRMVNERITLTENIDDRSSFDVEMPIMSRLVATWQDIDGPDIEVIGSVLYWEGNVTGVLRIEFDTRYDLVHINVTGITNTVSNIIVGTTDDQWLGVGWYSGSETGEELTDVQDTQCQVLAFYHYQYSELLLNKPEPDESVSAEDQQAVCRYAGSVHVNDPEGFDPDAWDITACIDACEGVYDTGPDLTECLEQCGRSCFKRVRYNTICVCGGDETSVIVDEPAPCPDGYNTGSVLNGGAVEDGGNQYVDCGSDDVSQDWFYEEKCCYPPDGLPLPKCAEHHAPFTGQSLTDEQSDAIKAEYGDDVKVISVGPLEGKCGEIITTQDVKQSNCCDGVSAIAWDADNSVEVIADDSSGVVTITGGILPYNWSVRGDGFWANSSRTVRDVTTNVPYLSIYTEDSCGMCTVSVSDGCSSISEYIRSTTGSWVQMGVVANINHWTDGEQDGAIPGGFSYSRVTSAYKGKSVSYSAQYQGRYRLRAQSDTIIYTAYCMGSLCGTVIPGNYPFTYNVHKACDEWSGKTYLTEKIMGEFSIPVTDGSAYYVGTYGCSEYGMYALLRLQSALYVEEYQC